MEKIILSIDLGYSGYCKMAYQGKNFKFQVSLDYYQECGLEYGDTNFYEFEGEKLTIGNADQTNDSFTTTQFEVLEKYGPLMIYYIIKKLGLLNDIDRIDLRLGLALIDWPKREQFIKRMQYISVKDENKVETNITLNNITLYTQGYGCGKYYSIVDNGGKFPPSLLVIDIGFNTINLLYFENGKPIANRCKPLPGHGISTIIRPFKDFLESNLSMNFNEAEVINIFMAGRMKIHGVEKPEVEAKILELKNVFIKKLMKQLMVSEKKSMALVDTVLFSGGGAYYIKHAKFPPNFVFNTQSTNERGIHEYENVLGYFHDTDYNNTVRIINGEYYEQN